MFGRDIRGIVKSLFKALVFLSVWEWLRSATTSRRKGGSPGSPGSPDGNTLGNDTYEKLYEAQAQAVRVDEAIGVGPYDLIGQIELDILVMEGLQPEHTLLDFGCGNGRLAVHAIPLLR